jgi:hypothetical protein
MAGRDVVITMEIDSASLLRHAIPRFHHRSPSRVGLRGFHVPVSASMSPERDGNDIRFGFLYRYGSLRYGVYLSDRLRAFASFRLFYVPS